MLIKIQKLVSQQNRTSTDDSDNGEHHEKVALVSKNVLAKSTKNRRYLILYTISV